MELLAFMISVFSLVISGAALLLAWVAWRDGRVIRAQFEGSIGEPYLEVRWDEQLTNDQAVCHLSCRGSRITEASVEVGKEKYYIGDMRPADPPRAVQFQEVAIGAEYKVQFVDPVTGKRRRGKGTVRPGGLDVGHVYE